MLPFFFGQLFWFENDNKFLDRPREREGHLVHIILDHGGSCVCPHVEGLVQRESNSDGSGNSPFRNLFPVDKQDAGSTFTVPATVISESKAQCVIPSLYSFLGGNAKLVS